MKKLIIIYKEHIAKQILVRFCVDYLKKVEQIIAMPMQSFSEKNCEEEKFKWIEIANNSNNGANLIFWYNKAEIKESETRVAVIWKLNNEKQTQKMTWEKKRDI